MFRCTWVPTYSRAHAEKCRSLPVLFRSFIFEAWLFRQVAIIKKKRRKARDSRQRMREKRWTNFTLEANSFTTAIFLSSLLCIDCHSLFSLSLSRSFLSSQLVHVLFSPLLLSLLQFIPRRGRTESRLVSNRKCFFRPVLLRAFFLLLTSVLCCPTIDGNL